MSDRRIGDRRQPEEGVIRIKFKDAVVYMILMIIIIISLATNIVLAINNNKYKGQIDEYKAMYDDSEEYEDEEDLDNNETSDDEISNEQARNEQIEDKIEGE